MINVFSPILLWTYEHELHGIIERILEASHPNILNIVYG